MTIDARHVYIGRLRTFVREAGDPSAAPPLLLCGSDDGVGSPRGIDVASATVVQGDLPPRPIALEPLAGSHWVAPAVSLPSSGTWALDIETLGRSEQTAFSVEIDIAEPPAG